MNENRMSRADERTAQAFATSWNTLPAGSVYTRDQVEDWLAPLTPADVAGASVLELGCGNASLLSHVVQWGPRLATGVDLGDSVLSATRNLTATGRTNWRVLKDDLVTYAGEGCDIVYCIGVLHHLRDPHSGLESVIRNTRPGGRFHCWVYGEEGNGLVIHMVDPLRRVVSALPWWFTKCAVALPLSIPFWAYAKAVALLPPRLGRRFVLGEYCRWIARREFRFFWHVAFDQLVTPQTAYIARPTIERWLAASPLVEPGSAYITSRNGNSWKFGGRRR